VQLVVGLAMGACVRELVVCKVGPELVDSVVWNHGFGIGCGLHIGVPDVRIHVARAVLFDGG